MGVNRRKWDESVPLHVASKEYDVPAFLRGRSTLQRLELQDVGPVRGKSLLHLQCHFGLDTLSWARRGARVTGVDFSLPAIKAARRLARELGVKAQFVQSNIYDLAEVFDRKFDIVYTGQGALCWLPDIEGWARVVSRFLKPGGRFYLLEDHPLADVFVNESATTRLELKVPYFGEQALREEYDGTYATTEKMKNRVTYSWIHPVSEILTSLINHGLVIESVREYPFTFWKRFSFMTRDRQGWWHLKDHDGLVPLMWSVRARRA